LAVVPALKRWAKFKRPRCGRQPLRIRYRPLRGLWK